MHLTLPRTNATQTETLNQARTSVVTTQHKECAAKGPKFLSLGFLPLVDNQRPYPRCGGGWIPAIRGGGRRRVRGLCLRELGVGEITYACKELAYLFNTPRPPRVSSLFFLPFLHYLTKNRHSPSHTQTTSQAHSQTHSQTPSTKPALPTLYYHNGTLLLRQLCWLQRQLRCLWMQ